MASPKPKSQKSELTSVLEQADAALARRLRERAGEAERASEEKPAAPALAEEEACELLDLTTSDHKERQRVLVANAERFVLSTSERVSSVLEHLEAMSGQADALYEN